MDYTLHLGDCIEYMKTLPDGSVDAVVTDPPYPGLVGGIKYLGDGVVPAKSVTETVGVPWGESLEALKEFRRIAKAAIVFCSWHSIAETKNALGGIPVGLVTWYRRNSQNGFRNRPRYNCEHAWLIEYESGSTWKNLNSHYDIPSLPAGCMATERILKPGTGKAAHPAQKPIKLIKELLSAFEGTIFDPFMGTGTTGVACLQTGRRFIGCEIDPTYFEIAQRRIEQAAMQPRLFDIAAD